MKLKQTAGVVFGIITCAACFACTTIGHYASEWVVGYYVGVCFALFGGLAVSLSLSDI
jgi:ABC-type multidrug transport system permease subunit